MGNWITEARLTKADYERIRQDKAVRIRMTYWDMMEMLASILLGS